MAELHLGDLDGLRLLADAARQGSISAAARQHGIAQPVATERLRRLEQRLGLALLERGPRGSEPTAAGRHVLALAEPVLRAVDELTTGARSFRDGVRRSVRVMASLTIADYFMPLVLQRFRAAGGPPVELTVGNSTAVTAALAHGDVQIGCIETPRRVTGFRSRTLMTDSLVVVVAPHHPWARRRRPLTPRLLAATPVLTREQGSGTRDAFEMAIRKAGHTPAPPLAVMGSTTMLKTACAAGDGACVISELAVAGELERGTLRTVPVDGLDLSRELRAVWSPHDHDPDIRAFLRIATDVAFMSSPSDRSRRSRET